jgi:peptidoglycan/LPS O-acetylase OafA/YrhL
MDAAAAISPVRRNIGLDVLRGIAILLVLGNHVCPDTIQALPTLQGFAAAAYWRMRCVGWSGVDLFFVLSGFLVSGLLFQEIESSGTIHCGRFWLRRAFKILPSYYGLLILLAAFQVTPWFDTTSTASMLSSIAAHGLFFQNYLSFNPNGPMWSLAVEEHFYLVLPPLLILLARGVSMDRFCRRVIAACILVAFATVCLRLHHALVHGIGLDDYRRTHFRIDALFFGVLTQLISRRHPAIRRWVAAHPRATLGAAAILVSPVLFLHRTHPLMFTVGYTFLSLGFGLVVLRFAHARRPDHPLLLTRAFATLGTWSYNLYLWNFFVGALPLPAYQPVQSWLAIHAPNPVTAVATQGFVFVLTSVAIAALASRVIERSFLRLRDYPLFQL